MDEVQLSNPSLQGWAGLINEAQDIHELNPFILAVFLKQKFPNQEISTALECSGPGDKEQQAVGWSQLYNLLHKRIVMEFMAFM